ncbi:MAG: hypothetical protein QOD07_186 [Frankiaceae bacterium]|jgi:hypothetical protein|nr:hypothetical protein [Frankiaceae bacterium]
MRRDLVALALADGGLVTRAHALARWPRHVLDDALNAGVLQRLHPGVYVVAGIPLDRPLLRRAALAYLPAAALSHVDALDVWGLCPTVLRAAAPIHLTAPHASHAVSRRSLVVHRRRGFGVNSSTVVKRDGLRVVRMEQAVVESWPLLAAADRRAPLIEALRARRTTADRLLATVRANRCIRGAAEIRELVALVDGGCHSELEIWGHERVFSDPRLPPSIRQHEVALDACTVFLDRYFPDERVDVELDGAAWHGQSGQRERDLRRDAALLARGILVVRYSHRRFVAEPELVVRELGDILAHRRVGRTG